MPILKNNKSTLATSYRGSFTKIKNAKGKKKSSIIWLTRQINDPYVVKAKLEGYRSRSAYKLIEINKKFKLLAPGMNILDIGAAPGGWSQVAAKITQSNHCSTGNKLIAVDTKFMEPIVGVTFIHKSIFVDDIEMLIANNFNNQFVDVVLSDIAANATGHIITDHLRIIDLCEKVFQISTNLLKTGGSFVTKIFRGEMENNFVNQMKKKFAIVKYYKPNATRKTSNEFYLIGIKKR